jgi:hypothetical protein
MFAARTRTPLRVRWNTRRRLLCGARTNGRRSAGFTSPEDKPAKQKDANGYVPDGSKEVERLISPRGRIGSQAQDRGIRGSGGPSSRSQSPRPWGCCSQSGIAMRLEPLPFGDNRVKAEAPQPAAPAAAMMAYIKGFGRASRLRPGERGDEGRKRGKREID